MKTCCVIIVPISGIEDTKKREIFDHLINVCFELTESKPVVVLDTKTRWNGNDTTIKGLVKDKKINLVECLCVDTCQMWLEGWNHVFKEAPRVERIVLLPGDLVQIADQIDFFNNLKHFISASSPKMLIGQINVNNKYSGKSLIDAYGVYPLLANWFPKVSKLIHGKHIERPRSEFLNMDARLLKGLLEKRSFAYEQTLNMIIRIVETPEQVGLTSPQQNELLEEWFEKHIATMKLGEVIDDSASRVFIGCIEQIERTDRLLRFVWRELNQPRLDSTEQEYHDFLGELSSLSRTSSEVRHAAIVAIRALLGA